MPNLAEHVAAGCTMTGWSAAVMVTMQASAELRNCEFSFNNIALVLDWRGSRALVADCLLWGNTEALQ